MSFDVSFLYNHEESSITFEQKKYYSSERCGICNKKEAETFWPNPTSQWAHYQCISKIAPAENDLITTINELFKDDRRRQNILHRHAIQAVMEKCKPHTIAEFADKNGIEEVKKLFNTFGMTAVKQFAEQEIFREFEKNNQEIITKQASIPLTEFGFAKL